MRHLSTHRHISSAVLIYEVRVLQTTLVVRRRKRIKNGGKVADREAVAQEMGKIRVAREEVQVAEDALLLVRDIGCDDPIPISSTAAYGRRDGLGSHSTNKRGTHECPGTFAFGRGRHR